MTVKVLVPTTLQKFTEGKASVEVAGNNVSELIDTLGVDYPGLDQKLRNDSGVLNRFINIYVNEEDIRFLENAETPLNDGDEVSLVIAVAGG
ncbi:MoaD/ThiS family protein [Roseofilum casamattae]|uniref:MoaD/ThiS family protein n=1 Tax=Roseofilum casamattae BLCC-M143 TaxID=3022442 RepID=A0ABT7BVZ7_9CYAN|nr:MoaD/ThiS family protein [Roseofilum casamattae]MDJ1182689.1 MoaD/ThiS family protein [Roseofilum casamattae BLCC-M143]